MRLATWILLAGVMTSNLLSVRAEDSIRVALGSAGGNSENRGWVQPPGPPLPVVPLNVLPIESASGAAAPPNLQALSQAPAPMQLQPIQPQTGVSTTAVASGTATVGLIPMTRLTSVQQPDAAGGPYRTADMIGPIGDATKFLSKWSTPDSNTYHPVDPLPVVRGYHYDPQSLVGWAESTYPWISPVFHYQPLYFEQPNLERYGNGTHPIFQPAVSSAHFFTSIALVPYKTLTHHPHEKVYTLGTLRPGNCNPMERHTLIGQSRVGELFRYWNPKSGY